jgi:chloramphenicol 3-O phosphotransferase
VAGRNEADAVDGPGPGQIVVLNGVPRAGKTAIAQALQQRSPGVWVNLGVDASIHSTPAHLRPGIGLRPGGERPDLEDLVVVLYAALFESVAAHARLGLDVVVDVGLHESYAEPRHVRRDSARRLAGLPVLFVGVRCPLDVIWQRRQESWGQHRKDAGPELVAAVQRWQEAVHQVAYDLEVDTSTSSPVECADLIAERIGEGAPGVAFAQLAAQS